jgi:hypothetical protein
VGQDSQKVNVFSAISLNKIYAACVFCITDHANIYVDELIDRLVPGTILLIVVALLTLSWRCVTIWTIHSDGLNVVLQKVTFGAPDCPGHKTWCTVTFFCSAVWRIKFISHVTHVSGLHGSLETQRCCIEPTITTLVAWQV